MRQQQFTHLGTIFCGRLVLPGKMRTRKCGEIPLRNGCMDVQCPLIFEAQKNMKKPGLNRGFRAGFMCLLSASSRIIRGKKLPLKIIIPHLRRYPTPEIFAFGNARAFHAAHRQGLPFTFFPAACAPAWSRHISRARGPRCPRPPRACRALRSRTRGCPPPAR